MTLKANIIDQCWFQPSLFLMCTFSQNPLITTKYQKQRNEYKEQRLTVQG